MQICYYCKNAIKDNELFDTYRRNKKVHKSCIDKVKLKNQAGGFACGLIILLIIAGIAVIAMIL